MRRKIKTELPKFGEAFAFPLEDGRYSVCRVILDQTSEQSKMWKGDTILVACSAWIGNTVPDAADVSLRPILHLTHHSWNNVPKLLWVSDTQPSNFIPIGTIEPTPEEKELVCKSFGGWDSITIQPLAQWRWDNDREAVLIEDEIEKKKDSDRRQKQIREREQYLSEITLEELHKRRFFPHWDEYQSTRAIESSRNIMTESIQQLISVGPTASESERMEILQNCIERFNDIDEELDYFISTIERDDICEEFQAIVHACGLGTYEDLADEWREW